MKILVVEDNKKMARFLRRAFSEEGYIVDQVSDGVSAVKQASSIHYDLVLLDWMLPELDGLAVCRELRAHHVRTPILMLTARAEVQERIAGLDMGADDYLTKPFDLGELMARCRALHRRSGEESLRLGPLFIDRNEHKVLLDNHRVELTLREFSLLAYLVQETGRAIPRSELLVKVWEMSFDPGSNLIEVHIKNLREKMGKYATMIETVRGVGYRLVLPATHGT